MEKRFFLHVLYGALIAAVTTVLLSLGLSVCVLFFDVTDGFVTICNQFIKVSSILLSVLLLKKKEPESEVPFGLAVGSLYIFLGISVFCALEGRLLPIFTVAAELALGLISGLLSGIAVSRLPQKGTKTRLRRRK